MRRTDPKPADPENKKQHPHLICFGKRRVHPWTIFLSLGIITGLLLSVLYSLGTLYEPATMQAESTPILKNKQNKVFSAAVTAQHRATDYLINTLKQHGLWKIQPQQEVPRFFIDSYPEDLYALDDISIKKRVFLHSLLPHALFVRQEALYKRQRLEAILSKIDCSPNEIDFAFDADNGGQCSWSGFLADDEVHFIRKLCTNYRTTTAEGLLERVDAVPTSIILAQGALESSWGSSRFAREGNSVFGMWTWRDQGIVPARRDDGKTHKVRSYDNILDAVRAYQLTLNRLDPYEQFRQLRRQTDDPLILAEGLSLYSERGKEYVDELKNIIMANNLQKYDTCRLSDLEISELSTPVSSSAPAAGPGKSSL